MRKRSLGILLLIVGIGSMFVASFIDSKVSEGQEQIDSGQKKVDMGNSLFSLSPATKDIGQGLTDSAQKKIDEGQGKVNFFAKVASILHIAGMGAAILGAILVVLSFLKKRK